MSLSSYLPDFLQVLLIEDGLSENTRMAYRRDIETFLDRLGAEDTVTADDIRAYVRYLGTHGYASASVQRKVAAIKRFCRYLYMQGVLSSDISVEVVLRAMPRALPVGIFESVMKVLLAQPDHTDRYGQRDRALLFLMYGAGLRVSEVCSLRLSQLGLRESCIRVVGKGNKERIVPLPMSVSQVIQAYIETMRPTMRLSGRVDWVFLSRGGRALSRQAVFQILRKYADRMGVSGMHPHQLRHAFATHLLNRDVSVRDVQVCLGHARLSTTQKYLSVSTAHLHRMYEKSHPLAVDVERISG
jgi:integrase/recombinase XerD